MSEDKLVYRIVYDEDRGIYVGSFEHQVIVEDKDLQKVKEVMENYEPSDPVYLNWKKARTGEV